MFPGQSLSQKISHQRQKNVSGRTIPANFHKFLIYGLLKTTQGCKSLDSEPDPTRASRKYNFKDRSNGTQCFNIPPIQQFALVLRQPLPQLKMPFSKKFVTAVLEKHLNFVDQYAKTKLNAWNLPTTLGSTSSW